MTEMIELVARAIAWETGATMADMDDWEQHQGLAVVAIKALREPTPEILDAMKANIGPLKEMWRGGIDAALGDKK